MDDWAKRRWAKVVENPPSHTFAECGKMWDFQCISQCKSSIRTHFYRTFCCFSYLRNSLVLISQLTCQATERLEFLGNFNEPCTRRVKVFTWIMAAKLTRFSGHANHLSLPFSCQFESNAFFQSHYISFLYSRHSSKQRKIKVFYPGKKTRQMALVKSLFNSPLHFHEFFF